MTNALISEVEKMYSKIEKLADEEVRTIWNALKNYNPKEEYAIGISMDTWAQAIYSEMDKRGIRHIVYISQIIILKGEKK